jgi:hypothetical protein
MAKMVTQTVMADSTAAVVVVVALCFQVVVVVAVAGSVGHS